MRHTGTFALRASAADHSGNGATGKYSVTTSDARVANADKDVWVAYDLGLGTPVRRGSVSQILA